MKEWRAKECDEYRRFRMKNRAKKRKGIDVPVRLTKRIRKTIYRKPSQKQIDDNRNFILFHSGGGL